MAYVPTILINLDEKDANYGNIESSFENTTIGGITENVYYQVTSPSGNIIKSTDLVTPDGTIFLAQPSANMPLVPLPVVANGDFEEGDYVVLFSVEDTAAPGVFIEVSLTFTLDILNQGQDTCVKKGLINFDVDCFCLQMTVTDLTDYSDVAFVSRELTIVPPTIPGQAAPVNIVTPDASASFSFSYSGVTYNANLYSVYEHVAVSSPSGFPDVIIRESLCFTEAYQVVCDHNLCKLFDCIEAFFEKCKKDASDVGGIQNLPFEKLEKWLCIENLLTMYSFAAKCNNTTLLEKIFKKVQEVTGCDCGCDSESSTQIIKLVAVCAGGSGVNTVNGNAPIVVNTVGSTATISLDATFTALVTSGLQSLVVDTGNNSSDYLTVGPGSTATERKITFDDNPFKYGAYTVSTDAKMVAGFGVVVSTVPLPIRWAKNEFFDRVVVDGSFRVNLASIGVPICLFDATVVSPIVIPTNSFTRSGPSVGCYNANGECIGSLQLGGFGVVRNLLFTANALYIVGDIVFTNGTFNLD